MKRSAIDAVAEPVGGRTIFEDMPEVAVAMLATDFGSRRHELTIDVFRDVLFIERLAEARPPGAALLALGDHFESPIAQN
jgi:hypothetical protein